MAVISDRGYVCDVQVIRGIDKEIDQKAFKTAREARFQPAKKDNRPVPVVVRLQVPYWRKDGELIHSPVTTQTQEESPH